MLSKLLASVSSNYSPELAEALRAGLAVVCSASMKGRSHPVVLIYEGPSGRGKSTVINLLKPDRDETKEFLYKLDRFTPASFVSNAANVSDRALAEIDLLPKIKGRTLLTKELAPLFRQREDALRENFSVLTAVLDGNGYRSASGTHGTRGYDGQYVFNWLGGTTPIPARTDAVMAQLGNRLLRYEIIWQQESEDDLVEFAMSDTSAAIEDQLRKETNNLILDHFMRYPPESIDQGYVSISEQIMRHLVRLAQLIAHGRREVQHNDEGEIIVCEPEGPHRIIKILKTLLQGLVLVADRRDVTGQDLDTLRHVAFSSIPGCRRDLLRALLSAGGELDSTKVEEIMRVSRPTARSYMREFAATEIADLKDGASNQPDRLRLAEKWAWLLPTNDTAQVAEKEMQLCV